MESVINDTLAYMLSKLVMHNRRFQTCDDINSPELIYIRDVEWSLSHWDDMIKCRGVVELQKPHFLFIEDPNDRLLFFIRWNDDK